MVDRVLYPRRKGASRKFVRNVRVSERREGAVVCDLVSENKRSSVLTMAAVMNTYKHSAERVTGRNRSHALPSKVAERLQTLKMTDSIRRAILGAIGYLRVDAHSSKNDELLISATKEALGG